MRPLSTQRSKPTMPLSLKVDPHPLLSLAAFTADLPAPLSQLPSPDWLKAGLAATYGAPLTSNDDVRAAVRDLLRHGGHKPTGRGKPASEYLLRTASEPDGIRSINAVVDACNVASLHSGLPISVVDLSLAKAPFRVGIPEAGASYVFNASGQTIDVGGLLSLFDESGPCANAVKDSQRTKTNDATTKVLAVIWGANTLSDRSVRTARFFRDLLEKLSIRTEDCAG